MSISIFFDPVEEYLLDEVRDLYAVRHQITINTGMPFPEWTDADLAVIGLTEERGTLNNFGATGAAEAVRREWYKLKKGRGRYRIVDLGNLRNGRNRAETLHRLREVCSTLLQHNVLVMLIGGTHDLQLGAYQAYEDLNRRITVFNVDSHVDLEADEAVFGASRTHLHDLFAHQPNYLFNFIHAGHQTYFIDDQMLSTLEKLHFDLLRLGALREDMMETEPYIREADMFSFDLSAIRQRDAPGNANAAAFGLTAEEACQLCWYAGMSNHLSLAGFYEYNPELDAEDQTAHVVAVMLWYLVEGFYHRKPERDFRNGQFVRYTVPTPSSSQELTFYKSKLSDRWWLEVPRPHDPGSVYYVPCSYRDYDDACKGMMPDRWLNTQARLI
ncbi:formiminoglutamase [Catalinimonas alkaloidigena]|uniref:Formiminoglutamase n=1 Tax=Catalinimonas alkaloidigena TaxID=1075417 RepID=A0A1G9M004_9BACT|nr:formimidoylglutamase [Catalinimonas alkaloidigena]SDL67600.1 formiminoglutamase [Catalinimonas alkaloidigena]